jgi:hypothetical protein
MQVHERYLGRSLRCTSCRTEFLAMLPADVDVEAVVAAPLEVENSGPRRSWTRHLRWLLGLIPLVLLVWWLGQATTGRVLGVQRTVGEIGVLEDDSGGPVVVALDPESAEVLVRAGDDVGGEDLRFLIEQGRGVEMARGTSVRVLESGAKGGMVRVRVISGPWESRKVWVPTRWVR